MYVIHVLILRCPNDILQPQHDKWVCGCLHMCVYSADRYMSLSIATVWEGRNGLLTETIVQLMSIK